MRGSQSGPLKHLSDEELVEIFQRTGEMTYFEEIWLRYFKVVYLSCLGFLRDGADAEDVTTGVFLKVVSGLRGRYESQHFRGWILTVARHLCINHVRQAAERLRGGTAEELEIAAPGDPTLAADVGNVLSRLTPSQRIAIKLLYVHRYSYQDIAAIQGWTLDEVKTHIQNGKRMFKQLWARTAQEKEP